MFLHRGKNPLKFLIAQKQTRQFRFALRNFSSDNGELIDPNCDPANPKPLTFAQISSAAFNIRDGIVHTDCRRSYNLSALFGMDLFLKLELNQVTGNFKERGARWALLRLNEEERQRGVWAASAGNHALSLSYHGKQLGVSVNVVMPEVAPLVKTEFCSRLGANVIIMGKDMAETRKLAQQKCVEAGGLYINGYDYIDCCAGAGTVGLEILQQVEHLDALLVPVGGGSLISGVSLAVKTLQPNVQIIGVESKACAGFSNALRVGHPSYTASGRTLADGLAVPVVGCNSFNIAKNYVDKVVAVSEEFIPIGILRLVECEKIVTEGAGAIPIAAILSGALPELRGKRVASIVTGGNIDSTALGRSLERGMVYDNRLVRFSTVVSDRPGGIKELLETICACGANIKDIFIERAFLHDIYSVRVKIVAETRGRDHVKDLERVLRSKHDDVYFHEPSFDSAFVVTENPYLQSDI